MIALWPGQVLAKEILAHCDNDHDAMLTFDEFIPW